MKKLFVLSLIVMASISAANAKDDCATLKAKSDKGDAEAKADFQKAIIMGECSEAGETLKK